MALTKRNSLFNQNRLLTAELTQLDYNFEKAKTLQEKTAIHNLFFSKGKERKNQLNRFNLRIKL